MVHQNTSWYHRIRSRPDHRGIRLETTTVHTSDIGIRVITKLVLAEFPRWHRGVEHPLPWKRMHQIIRNVDEDLLPESSSHLRGTASRVTSRKSHQRPRPLLPRAAGTVGRHSLEPDSAWPSARLVGLLQICPPSNHLALTLPRLRFPPPLPSSTSGTCCRKKTSATTPTATRPTSRKPKRS